MGIKTSALRVKEYEVVFNNEQEAIDYLAPLLWPMEARITATNMVRGAKTSCINLCWPNLSIVSNAKAGGMMQVQFDGRWGILHIGR